MHLRYRKEPRTDSPETFDIDKNKYSLYTINRINILKCNKHQIINKLQLPKIQMSKQYDLEFLSKRGNRSYGY